MCDAVERTDPSRSQHGFGLNAVGWALCSFLFQIFSRYIGWMHSYTTRLFLRGVQAYLNEGDQKSVSVSTGTVDDCMEGVTEVEQVRPNNGTPLGERLDDVCRGHLRKLNGIKWKLLKPLLKPLKRCLIIAITDGAPSE